MLTPQFNPRAEGMAWGPAQKPCSRVCGKAESPSRVPLCSTTIFKIQIHTHHAGAVLGLPTRPWAATSSPQQLVWLQPEQVAAGERLCTPSPITQHLLLPASRHSRCSIPNKSLLLCHHSKSILRRATRPHKEQLIINYTPMVFQPAPIHHGLLDAFNQSASLSYSNVSLLFYFF